MDIFCATWNVAACPACEADSNGPLRSMLIDRHATSGYPDVYALSLQEIVPLNVVNILISASDTQAALDSWTDVVLRMLNHASPNSYVLLHNVAVVGTGLIVCVHKKHMTNGTIDADTVMPATLNLGKLYTGNKAAVAIRARIGEHTVCFVSAHFAAHRGSGPAQTRTEHMTYTVQQLAFYGGVECEGSGGSGGSDSRPPYTNSCTPSANSDASRQLLADDTDVHAFKNIEVASLEVFDHDVCILLGDLNSRMRSEIDQAQVWHVVRSNGGGDAAGDHVNHTEIAKQMLAWDEMASEPMASTLHNLRFQEGPIAFAPTYKITPNTPQYHVPPAAKPHKIFNHCPAWCDRILYAVRPGIVCRQGEYHSAPVFVSDHLPVFATFHVLPGSVGSVEDGSAKTESFVTRTAHTEEARLKSLRFKKVKSSSRDVCGGGDCTVM